MKSLGSLVSVGLIAVALSGVTGCRKDEPPKPDPAASAKSASSARNKLNTRNPMGPVAKIDPQAMKDYRLDICYYGTLSLRQARDAYLGSLGKDEPSEKKIPSFGIPAPPGVTAPGTGPSGAPNASAAPKAPPAPSAKPSASAAAAPSGSAAAPPPDRRPDNIMMRAPHERNARACTAAVALKEPPMGDVDAAVSAYATYAVDLAKDIAAAHTYYVREEYKKDSFAKGKELDKKLREGFAKLDEMQSKLGTALTGWRGQHAPDTSKMEEGEKTARAALDDAREVFLMIAMKKADGDAWKTGMEKLDKSVAALKAFADGHAADPWAKIMTAPFEVFVKTVKETKLTAEKTFDADGYLALVTNFTGLIEARQRAISRNAMARPLVQPVLSPSGAPQAPAPAPENH